MAATQAEKQQNDVNSEKVQSEQHLNVRNSLLQNGTDKSGARGVGSVVHTKAKNTAGKNIAIEMSQYRQDGSGGGSAPVSGQTNTASGPSTSGAPDSTAGTETSLSGESESSNQGTGSSANAPPKEPNMYSGPGEGLPIPPSSSDGHGYGFAYARDVHNSSEGNMHGGFSPRQPFGAPKQMPPHQQHQPHQRFVTGPPSMPQPSGTTPTLNQLLQSNNSMPNRYPNSYGHPEQHYNQAWPSPQKSHQQGYAPPSAATGPSGAPAQSYRIQPSVSYPLVITLLNASP